MRRRDFIAGLSGAAAVWPLVAQSQQQALPVIGWLGGEPERGSDRYIGSYRRGLAELGYVEGRNFESLYRFAEQQYDRLPALAADLVRRRVDVIATGGHFPALAAKAATATIPIVFSFGADPVQLGLVASLSRPGGNVTGATFLSEELTAKRFELLREIAPATTSVGFLVNPTTPNAAAQIREAENAVRVLGVHLMIQNASNSSQIETAFATFVGQRIGALLVAGDPFFGTQSMQLVALAAHHSVPVIYSDREAVDAGGLMSYGPNVFDAFRLAGTYVGRILKGEKPADLPVQRSTYIDMVLNLKTAKTLGMEVPTATLLRATEVIE